MTWPHWLFWEIRDAEAAGLLIAVIVIQLIWATTMIVSGYQWARKQRYGRWHVRRVLPPHFSFWLGAFMTFDAAIYAVFVSLILRSPGGTDLWMLLLISGLAGSAIKAFYFWGRELRKGGEQ